MISKRALRRYIDQVVARAIRRRCMDAPVNPKLIERFAEILKNSGPKFDPMILAIRALNSVKSYLVKMQRTSDIADRKDLRTAALHNLNSAVEELKNVSVIREAPEKFRKSIETARKVVNPLSKIAREFENNAYKNNALTNLEDF